MVSRSRDCSTATSPTTRKNLSACKIISCAGPTNGRVRGWVYTAGLVVARQKSTSHKGDMFITIEN